MANDDMGLVRQYAAHQSESAFAALVSRHSNLVYSTALRLAHDHQLAQEITQAVFILLARKAGSLNEKTIVPSWLYRTACYASYSALKIELRRHQREQEAYMQSTLDQAQTDAAWKQVAPLLEQAMLKLPPADRDALVLRFFEGRTLTEVGVALGASEDAARKRVHRALERLRGFFIKHGVASTTSLIAGAISANSVQAAPQALAQSVTAVAVAKGAAASSSTLTLIQGALKLMAWTKAKTAVVAGSLVILAALVVTPVYIHRFSASAPISAIASPADYPQTAEQAAKAVIETLFIKGDVNEFADKFGDPNPVLRKLFIDNFTQAQAARAQNGRPHAMSGAQVVSVDKPEKRPDSNVLLVPCKIRLQNGTLRECQVQLKRNPENNRWIFKNVR